jgi:hypothetical protein
MRGSRGSFAFALFSILIACGGDDGSPAIDGPPGNPDAPVVDAGPGDARRELVTVEVIDDADQPVAGAQVLFEEAGAVISEQTTDALGQASAVMDIGASVTVVRTIGMTHHAITYADLRYGAQIRSQATYARSFTPVTFTWSTVPGIESYQVFTTCYQDSGNSTTGTTLAIDLDTRCSGSFDAAVIGYDNNGLLAPVTQVLIGASGPTVTFAGGFVNAASVPAQVTNAPSIPLSAGSTIDTRDDRPSADPINFGGMPANWALPAVQRVARLQFTTPERVMMVFDRFAGTDTTYDVSLDGVLLPMMSDATVDLTTRTLSWNETAPPGGTTIVAPDIVYGQLHFSRGGENIVWRFVGRGSRLVPGVGVMTLPFPDIPGDRGFEPIAGDVDVDSRIMTFAANPGATLDPLVETLEPAFHDQRFFGATGLDRLTFTIAYVGD